MKAFLEKFLKEVAWPAVAGNVAWSFATLAIEGGINADTAPRLCVLFVLAIYLGAEWYRSTKINVTTSVGLWLDFFFAILVIWFAIATQADKGLPGAALLVILFGIGVGHLRGVWPPKGKGKGNIPHGWVSLVVALILGVAWLASCSWNPWFALGALSVVLVVWATVRRSQTE